MISKDEVLQLNDLYNKSKTQLGLSDTEKEEQNTLRTKYINAVKEKIEELINKDAK